MNNSEDRLNNKISTSPNLVVCGYLYSLFSHTVIKKNLLNQSVYHHSNRIFLKYPGNSSVYRNIQTKLLCYNL
jgi:hypothetical protein